MRIIGRQPPRFLRSRALLHVVVASLASLTLPGLAFANDPASEFMPQLIDSDPEIRRKAIEAIERLGPKARPSIVEATRSPDPQLARQAKELLLRLPWAIPSDPDRVRTELRGYGAKPVYQRVATALSLRQVSGSLPAMLRIITEDPSEVVQWDVAAALARQSQPPMAMIKALRALDLGNARPPLLMLVASSTVTFDRKRSLDLFARAVQEEITHPTIDGGMMDEAFATLAEEAARAGNAVEALRLRRALAGRVGITREDDSIPVYELFRFHAEKGPFDGYDADLKRFADAANEPEGRYCAGKLLERSGDADAAKAKYAAALALSSGNPQRRDQVARYLMACGWDDLAEPELRAAIAEPLPPEETQIRWVADTNAWIAISKILESRGDDAGVAQALENAVSAATGHNARSAQIEGFRLLSIWHRVKAAKIVGDNAAMEAAIAKLLPPRLQPRDPAVDPTPRLPLDGEFADIRLELLPLLRTLNRNEDADELFQEAYEPLRAQLNQSPDDPVSHNQLAWTCARSGERVAEGLTHARKAVELCPDAAAFLDTLAEAEFRSGNVPAAIRAETRALELRPEDRFMKTQLKRFRDGSEK